MIAFDKVGIVLANGSIKRGQTILVKFRLVRLGGDSIPGTVGCYGIARTLGFEKLFHGLVAIQAKVFVRPSGITRSVPRGFNDILFRVAFFEHNPSEPDSQILIDPPLTGSRQIMHHGGNR